MGETRLPEWPYKGLSYYRTTDAAIFGARNKDVRRIARRLAERKTRLLVLHGRTGCGKSSFLRAGLIPFLEREGYGFRFLREPNGRLFGPRAGSAFFVRATGSPLMQIGLALGDLCRKPVRVTTPSGEEKIDLGGVVGSGGKWERFLEGIDGGNGNALIQALRKVSELLPSTLVIIVDQGEEVVTQGGPARSREFFEFMKEFCRTKMDLKLLIALRSEYYGDFDDGVSQVVPAGAGMEREKLWELEEEEVRMAIEYPTRIESYNFEYDDGVVEHIARDLMATPTRGGKLAVMQMVCGRLYRDAKSRAKVGEPVVVRLVDYERLGGVLQQVVEHVDGVLNELCRREGRGWWDVDAEVHRWYGVLKELVIEQVDGTVTTNQRTEGEMREKVGQRGCRVPFSPAVAFLCQEDQRILRRDEVYHLGSGGGVLCYSLGHDSIGLAVSLQNRERELVEKLRRRDRVRVGLLVSYGALVSSALWVEGSVGNIVVVVGLVCCGILLLLDWWRGWRT